MPDTFTDVSSESWGGKLRNSIGGLLIGVLLGIIAIPLLVWNEHKAITTARALAETGGQVAAVSPETIDPSHEGKPVYVTGKAETAQTLHDPQYGVSAAALKLERDGQIYQWQEKEQTESHDKLGGGKETVTNYTYSTVWSNQPINSANFKHPEGHANPPASFAGQQTQSATDAHLGAFKIGGDILNELSADTAVPLDEKAVTEAPAAVRTNLHLSGGTEFYLGKDPQNPVVGDQKFSFKSLPPTEISVIAEQSGSGLSPYVAKSGASVLLVQRGAVSPTQMVADAKSSNSTRTWILRGVGFILTFIGFFALFSPFIALADILPFFGTLAEIGAGIFAFFAAFIVTTVTIAVAWFAVRPMLSIGLFVAAAVGIHLLHGRHRAALARQTAGAAA